MTWLYTRAVISLPIGDGPIFILDRVLFVRSCIVPQPTEQLRIGNQIATDFSIETSVALTIAKTLSPTLRFIRLTEPVVIIAVTSPEAVRSISSETTLSETIPIIVPGIRFRMLEFMLMIRYSITLRRAP